MKFALKNKWLIVIGLILMVGMLFATTFHVYGLNNEYNMVRDNIQKVQTAKKEAAKMYLIRETVNETSTAMADPIVEVAAAPLGGVSAAIAEAATVPQEEVVYEEEYVEEPYVEETFSGDYSSGYDVYYTAGDLRFQGVIYAGDWRWTWYSQNVLPGGGLQIPGRHVDENGYICDENDRICLASSDLAWGTVVSTPFGKEGCVYDCGCASGTLDVYVDF